MAEYVYPQDQTVQDGQNVLFMDSIPCAKHYVVHRNGSGILTLRGIVNNPCAGFARYFVESRLDFPAVLWYNSGILKQLISLEWRLYYV